MKVISAGVGLFEKKSGQAVGVLSSPKPSPADDYDRGRRARLLRCAVETTSQRF